MATQKKGCGLLITTFVILLLGGGITIFLGISAFNSGKDFAEKIDRGESFVTPKTLSYTPRENSEVTLWILGDEDVDFTEIEIESTSPKSRSNSPIFQPVSQVRQPRLTAQTILTTNIILPTFA